MTDELGEALRAWGIEGATATRAPTGNTAETWFVQTGAPVFALIAEIEPSCWPVVT